MYNLLEYSKNYRETTDSLLNYYRDKPNNPPLVGNPPTVNDNADPITNSASFKYKASITGKTSNANQENGENTEQGNTKDKKNLEIVVPQKHLSNFYVPVVTLSTENDKKVFEQLRTGFKITIKCNKYRSKMANQTKNNNINYLIDQTFT